MDLSWESNVSAFYYAISEKAMAPHSSQYSCLENPMDEGAWWAAVHGIAKSQTRLSNFTFTFHFHALEKEMANHSSVLAWRIPGTGEPCGLPSMGSHRVGHDWSNLATAAAAGSSCPWDFPDKNIGVGCHFLLQGIFLSLGSNPHLLQCQMDSLPLNHLGSPTEGLSYTIK